MKKHEFSFLWPFEWQLGRIYQDWKTFELSSSTSGLFYENTWATWYIPVISTLGVLRQEDYCKFRVSWSTKAIYCMTPYLWHSERAEQWREWKLSSFRIRRESREGERQRWSPGCKDHPHHSVAVNICRWESIVHIQQWPYCRLWPLGHHCTNCTPVVRERASRKAVLGWEGTCSLREQECVGVCVFCLRLLKTQLCSAQIVWLFWKEYDIIKFQEENCSIAFKKNTYIPRQKSERLCQIVLGKVVKAFIELLIVIK